MDTDEYVLEEPRPEWRRPRQWTGEPAVDEPPALPEELQRYATVFEAAAAELEVVFPEQAAGPITRLRWAARHLRPPYPRLGPAAFDSGGPLGAGALSRMAAHYARDLRRWQETAGYGHFRVNDARMLLEHPDRLDELLADFRAGARTAEAHTP